MFSRFETELESIRKPLADLALAAVFAGFRIGSIPNTTFQRTEVW
jgi:hypothetical protein